MEQVLHAIVPYLGMLIELNEPWQENYKANRGDGK